MSQTESLRTYPFIVWQNCNEIKHMLTQDAMNAQALADNGFARACLSDRVMNVASILQQNGIEAMQELLGDTCNWSRLDTIFQRIAHNFSETLGFLGYQADEAQALVDDAHFFANDIWNILANNLEVIQGRTYWDSLFSRTPEQWPQPSVAHTPKTEQQQRLVNGLKKLVTQVVNDTFPARHIWMMPRPEKLATKEVTGAAGTFEVPATSITLSIEHNNTCNATTAEDLYKSLNNQDYLSIELISQNQINPILWDDTVANMTCIWSYPNIEKGNLPQDDTAVPVIPCEA